MASNERDVVLDHDYDGIREYDNPTPGWWNFIFFMSFVFSVWYFLYYHASTISTSVNQGYANDVTEDLKKRFSTIGDLEPDESTLNKYMGSAEWAAVGASVFKTNCVSCHGAEGAGQIGPNLTDDHWKNVRKISDLPQIVMNGAAAGAMPAWKTRLHPNEIVLVSAYVASLRGKNLPGPRGPEGERIPDWNSASAPAATQ
jgi:cytochrome c oxidase cbb3-type subunit III